MVWVFLLPLHKPAQLHFLRGTDLSMKIFENWWYLNIFEYWSQQWYGHFNGYIWIFVLNIFQTSLQIYLLLTTCSICDCPDYILLKEIYQQQKIIFSSTWFLQFWQIHICYWPIRVFVTALVWVPFTRLMFTYWGLANVSTSVTCKL